jgi:hypothetical protein
MHFPPLVHLMLQWRVLISYPTDTRKITNSLIFAPRSIFELLVLVFAVTRTVPDLKLRTVRIVAVGDFETFGTVV